ncbi:MAG: glutamine amidotransferase [Clostridiales bacterium]|nr:glutamine amidotransferase [Clostridiales bacterium]
MDKLKVCHLYPDLLNLYGDRGNIIALEKRLEWRGLDMELINISVGDKFNSSEYDIVFIGGGQDFEQEVLLSDLSIEKKKNIKFSIEDGVVFLAICGGYQLLGTHYKSWDNIQYDFIGAIDIHTIGQKKRMIGDFMFNCSEPELSGLTVTGFENHSGRTYLGKSVKPLGTIKNGFGNNGEDKTAGARYKNVFCSYSHGPILPKNPVLSDYILETALKRKYGEYSLAPLNDITENNARNLIIDRLL